MWATVARPPVERQERGRLDLDARVDEILNRHPAVGLAIGVVRNGSLEFFRGHGLADITTDTPVTRDTVFRIGSVTKLFTAIAVLQLWEEGLVDLDAPAGDYLRAYPLIPAKPEFRPATVRHLLTHTAGIPDIVHPRDLLHPGWGSFGSRPATGSVGVGERSPSLAEYYRAGLRSVVEPGSVFAYTSHGFATLGQIVEDVSGMPLERRLRERIFEPLGMADTDLVRSDRNRSHLATGYDFGPGGPEAVTDREWVGRAAGGIYSSSRDMARFVAALLGGGANEHGSVLRPATLATMFQPHHRPDPRLPGMGLGFFLADACGHRFVGHDGLLPGFNADLLVAPDDALGVFGFTNGSSGAFTWLPIELERLLRRQLHLPDDAVRGDIPHHPEIWSELCGRYRLPPRVSDQRGRLAMGGGVQVFVRGGRLMARMLTPVPALYRGIPLHPDDERDPFVFRADLSRFGMPTVRLVFSREPGRGTTAIHTDLQSLSLFRQPAATRGRALAAGAVVGLGFATAATAARRRRGHVQGAST